MVIRLTDEQVVAGRNRGFEQYCESKRVGHADICNSDFPLYDVENNFSQGYIAEIALSQAIGVPVQKFSHGGADLKGRIECRASKYDNAHLPIKKGDANERFFFLLTGRDDVWQVRGWIYADCGKKERYWKRLAGTALQYWIPQSELLPLDLWG